MIDMFNVNREIIKSFLEICIIVLKGYWWVFMYFFLYRVNFNVR